jgi:hypothetical protein
LNEADLWEFYAGTVLYKAPNRQEGRHFGVKISYNRAILHPSNRFLFRKTYILNPITSTPTTPSKVPNLTHISAKITKFT